jgi:hypothetical protein
MLKEAERLKQQPKLIMPAPFLKEFFSSLRIIGHKPICNNKRKLKGAMNAPEQINISLRPCD